MEITWYGYSCFRLSERGSASVVTDPYDDRQSASAPLKLSADIVTVSNETLGPVNLKAINGTPYVITGPGEYEVGGVFITGIQTGKQKVFEATQNVMPNTLYVFDFDSLTVAHLGSLDRILTQAELEAIGTVNVALVPIGSEHSLNAARAAEVISLIEPNIVIPMLYATSGGASLDALSKFLKEMGLSEVAKQPSLKITSASLPEETQVIVLDCQHEIRSNP
jgi:L-ascorbate metabolism protein UlaG (beta-lactamase superfamily)